MSLLASGPVAAGSTRGAASVRASRSPYGPALRSRKATPVRAAAAETEVAEAPKGTVGIGGLFAGLAKLGTTGTVQLKSKKEEKKAPATKGGRDDSVVFVAGATGRTGARVVRELLDAGFTVRAGARNVEAAEAALGVAATYGIIKPESLKRVTVVQLDLGSPDGFEAAIGNANKIVCAVGAPEDQALNFSAPKKIDGEGTIALVNKAAELGVGQFVLISSLGTGKLGWPAGVLNLFGGVLVWKREAEKALEASGMVYTIVRPGGMERPTDDYKKTHNVVLKPRDSTFGGQVSRLQVAELVAAACAAPAAAENKVLEVVAETTAPPRPFEEMMGELAQDVSREAQLANKEAVDAARAELAAAQLKASAAAAALLEADKRVSELAARLKEAKATETAVKKEVAPLLKQAKPLETQLAEARSRAEKAALLESASKLVLERARKAAGAGVLLSDKERAAIVEEVLNPKPATPEPAPAPKVGSSQIFGFFGKKPEPAGPTEEEKAAAEAEAAAAAAAAEAEAAKAKVGSAKIFGFFGKKPEPAGPTEAEKAAAAEAEAAAAAAAAAAEAEAAAKAKPAPVPLFAGFFGAPKPAEKAPEPEPEPLPEPAPAPPPAAAKKARAAPPPPPPKPEPVVAVAAAPAAAEAAPEVVVEEAKPLFDVGSFFGGFMKKAEEQQAAPAAEPEPTPAPAPQPQPVLAAVAAAPAAAPAVEKPTPAPAPKPKPAPAKPAAPAVDPAEEERRRKVVEAAKAALAAEAAPAPAKAPEPAPAPAPAPAPEPVKAEAPAPEPAKAEAPAPTAEKPAEAAPAPAAEAPAPAAAAEAPAPAPAPAAEAPKPAKKAGDYDEAAAAQRKKEAQEWIAAWKAKQAGGSEAAAEEANPVAKFFGSLFG